MSATYSYTVSPASLHGQPEPRSTGDNPSTTPATDPQQLLSPYSSHTPAESTSSLSLYQSDFGSDFDDPFFGVNFNDPEGGTPSFLDDPAPVASQHTAHAVDDSWGRQLEPTSSHDTNPAEPYSLAPQLTPDTNGEGWSSAESPALAATAMTSPRVMVSLWGKDGEGPIHTAERTFTPGTESSRNLRLSNDDALSVETLHGSLPSVARDAQGGWMPDSATGQRGLDPNNRPSGETLSINQIAAARKVSNKNQEVASWVTETVERAGTPTQEETSNLHIAEDDNIPDTEIPLGHTTVNRHVPGQVYYRTELDNDAVPEGPSNGISQTDFDLIPARNWDIAPMLPDISPIDSRRIQPESSQAAIEKLEKMYDTESVVSHAATWGTRRRSLPSLLDTEGIISGSFLRKLTIRNDSTSPRRSSLLKKIPSLVRRPSASQLLKRKGSNGDEVATDDAEPKDRRESRDSLAPPFSRTSSWGIRQKQMPSLNTAIVGMGTGVASIGASHARSGSISASPLASPKSPFGLAPVKNTLRRPRSKTEIPRTESSTPNIVGMLRKTGGPPVAQLAKSQPTVENDDDDEDEDDVFDDSDMKVENGKAGEIIPTFEGFQQHILRLNPALANTNAYLVERIAYQMIARFKTLQSQKIKHIKAANSRNCNSGMFCVAQGGIALPLDNRSDNRGIDPLSARPDSSDGDVTPLEGGINAESFPTGIPMPPTGVLPAEFECQICFSSRKFIKPSDWTKHVHEDVQPFTCTWEKCRDPKMFKRKADWVRHENEGHRHLEWWTCDVDDCRHTCYRRDNFLQHLVREHKFAEPKVKTKAAIKKAGGADPTWQKVEKCHVETPAKPQDEQCKFCNKTFPTWKKLTVHLAKHMEHISLPVLRLVAAKDLHEDTVISPVQDPPPRNFTSASTPVKQEVPSFSQQRPHAFSTPIPINYSHSPQGPFGFQNMATTPMTQFYNQHQPNTHFDGMNQNSAGGLMMPQATTGFPTQQYQAMPVSTGSSYGQTTNSYMPMQNQLEPFPAYSNPLGLQDPTGGQVSYDTMTNTVMPNIDQYSNHGSVSPYSHSPNPGNGGFYTHQ